MLFGGFFFACHAMQPYRVYGLFAFIIVTVNMHECAHVRSRLSDTHLSGARYVCGVRGQRGVAKWFIFFIFWHLIWSSMTCARRWSRSGSDNGSNYLIELNQNGSVPGLRWKICRRSHSMYFFESIFFRFPVFRFTATHRCVECFFLFCSFGQHQSIQMNPFRKSIIRRRQSKNSKLSQIIDVTVGFTWKLIAAKRKRNPKRNWKSIVFFLLFLERNDTR